MLEKHWQAPKKKTKAQSHKILAGTKKSKKDKKRKKSKKKAKKAKIPNLWGSRILSRCWDFAFFFFSVFSLLIQIPGLRIKVRSAGIWYSPVKSLKEMKSMKSMKRMKGMKMMKGMKSMKAMK